MLKSGSSRFRGRVSLGALGVISLLTAIIFGSIPAANSTLSTGPLIPASLCTLMFFVNESLNPQEDQLIDAKVMRMIFIAVIVIGIFFTLLETVLDLPVFYHLSVIIALTETVIAFFVLLGAAIHAYIYFQDRKKGD